ncbi:right-handed parallel beta-helix repeat-containing protein [Halorientalis pallida]|uniref:Right-handed parallel beta-helix repeat-containing protein n=1 Tax=Halorientalis pallida TaxID=2479928 RepID=A0A498L7M5_9EURY|nr:right-handed parallel beta-helix repeat-containing protein [Halorientalis pallida]RXK51765.1 right-handed parallel beta-helix repeat-containing protein [Halorientalis pallida]
MTRRLGRVSARRLLAAVTVAAVALALLPAGTAAQATPVDSCRTIEDAGRYTLAGNLSANASDPCLRITTSDVTLDGRENAVVGSDTDAAGVLVEPTNDGTLRNVTVSNLTTTGWEAGLAYRGGVATGAVRNVTAADNRDGIVIDPRFRFQAASGTISLIDNTAVGNERWGVTLRPGADSDRVVGTRVRDNEIGLVVVDLRNVTLADTHAANNSWGVVIGDTTATTLRNTTVRDNERDGLQAGNGFDDSRMVDTTARANGGAGVRLGPASNVTLRNATAVDNGESGLVVRDASDLRATTLTVTGNGRWGLDFDGLADALLVNVTAGENAAGFYTATDSGNVTIESV